MAVSEDSLNHFKRDKVRAVLAHEIGHLANDDMITLRLIQGVVNTLVMFFARIIDYTVDKVIFKNERGYGIGFYVAAFVAEIILGVLASIIVIKPSPYREYRVVDAGVTLADRSSIINALKRLSSEKKHKYQAQCLISWRLLILAVALAREI